MRRLDVEKTIAQFNAWAPTYDSGLWSPYFDHCRRTVMQAVNPYLRSNLRVLDAGCGTGNLILDLWQLEPSAELVGIDMSDSMLEIACNKPGMQSARACFMQADASRMPFRDESFDIILCLNAFHHFHEPLGDITRVLKQGGLLVLVDNSADGPLRRLWIRLLKAHFDEGEAAYHGKGQLVQLLERYGLNVVKQTRLLYFVLVTICRKEG